MTDYYRSLAVDVMIPEIAEYVALNAEDWEVRDVVSKFMPEHILMTERDSAARYRHIYLVLAKTTPENRHTQECTEIIENLEQWRRPNPLFRRRTG